VVHKEWIPKLTSHTLARVGLAALLAAGLMAGYFLIGWAAAVALLLAHVSAVVLTGSVLISRSPRTTRPGRGLALGLFFYLLLVYFNAFAFTYPYALPFMRGLGWAVYLAASAILLVGMLALRGRVRSTEEWMQTPIWLGAGAALLVGAALVWGIWEPVAAVRGIGEGENRDPGVLRIATYNIHYGYDEYWHYTLDEMARTMEAEGVDVVALQEVDTGRLTSYGVDNALYLARRLGMQAVYVPAVEHLTGIALLYRPEARETAWILLPSLQEQTGLAYAHLQSGQQGLHAYGIWMGLSKEDTQAQIDSALAFIGDASPAVFGGDFNARPNSPVAETIRQAGFEDPFVILGIDPPPGTSPAIEPNKQIDYVWVRGLTVRQAWVSPSLASDHRMVVVEVEAP
jgi:endonuclease/exonuclease/phosphatase family metal-dependent hydrolase